MAHFPWPGLTWKCLTSCEKMYSWRASPIPTWYFWLTVKTAKNPMDVEIITDVVAERVYHKPIGGIPRSGLPWFWRVVKFPLCTCRPLGPGPRSLDPLLVRDYQGQKNTLILNTQLEVSCSYQFARPCMASFQVAFTPRLCGMNRQLWQAVWNISCLRWCRRLLLKPRDLKFGLPTWNKHRNGTVQWHVPK